MAESPGRGDFSPPVPRSVPQPYTHVHLRLPGADYFFKWVQLARAFMSD
ncbi:predicted protein [Sclerotinia sclerotiorum 1980 UF-70]|uniref:Uncharacterized protein n=1 Tax=Sclerotinia sclerotiorum (strain ATCC 18683 / 1980 / Ss-1) TaxID=665079 RepID=A7EWE7_SCLS1|nr:predicted protein [Sclerotinia sclerotiorum 1980 UF-70]EDN93789.1 predicted protein [Sclerotinia sclerotiorum 1980 UF-70]